MTALTRYRSAILLGAALLAAVAVVVVFGTTARSGTPMDPDNPGPGGAQALARVLDDRGVDVDVVRGADALAGAGVDPATTVVVVQPAALGSSTITRLLDDTRDAAGLVVVAAGPGVVEELGGRGGAEATLRDGRDAGCDDPRFAGLTIEVDTATVYDGGSCFAGADGAVAAGPRPALTLFGADQALTNEQVLRADNAAVGLRLLGATGRLVWYVPDPADLVGADGVSLRTLLPRWVQPALVLGIVVLVSVVIWRGRRLGALAVEPLPVVVRAIETTRSLGRLYRRSGDRGHAADALRRSARARCAERLRLGSRADPDTVVREVARHTGRPPAEVARLLAPDSPAPPTDADLITVADRLAELDREVGRT